MPSSRSCAATTALPSLFHPSLSTSKGSRTIGLRDSCVRSVVSVATSAACLSSSRTTSSWVVTGSDSVSIDSETTWGVSVSTVSTVSSTVSTVSVFSGVARASGWVRSKTRIHDDEAHASLGGLVALGAASGGSALLDPLFGQGMAGCGGWVSAGHQASDDSSRHTDTVAGSSVSSSRRMTAPGGGSSVPPFAVAAASALRCASSPRPLATAAATSKLDADIFSTDRADATSPSAPRLLLTPSDTSASTRSPESNGSIGKCSRGSSSSLRLCTLGSNSSSGRLSAPDGVGTHALARTDFDRCSTSPAPVQLALALTNAANTASSALGAHDGCNRPSVSAGRTPSDNSWAGVTRTTPACVSSIEASVSPSSLRNGGGRRSSSAPTGASNGGGVDARHTNPSVESASL